jgi:hypothetical protein
MVDDFDGCAARATGDGVSASCERVRGRRALPWMGEAQAITGIIPFAPRPGRGLQVYDAAGRCILRTSPIRLLVHEADATLVVTRNAMYRLRQSPA